MISSSRSTKQSSETRNETEVGSAQQPYRSHSVRQWHPSVFGIVLLQSLHDVHSSVLRNRNVTTNLHVAPVHLRPLKASTLKTVSCPVLSCLLVCARMSISLTLNFVLSRTAVFSDKWQPEPEQEPGKYQIGSSFLTQVRGGPHMYCILIA